MALVGDSYEYLDNRFRALTIPIAKVECLFDGCLWAEGPVWFADANQLVWSDIPNRRMLRWVPDLGVSVFRADSSYSNGNTRDREGRLVTCEHGGRRVTRTEPDGSITVIADAHAGKRLNSPNDVVVKSDGSIWFTDPSYGILSDYEGFRAEPEQDGCHVYRVDPATGDVAVVADDFVKPNGLAFSPDESILYVADSGFSHDPAAPHHIRAFDVVDGRKLASSRVFAEVSPGVPDGFRCDVDGNVWTSCQNGVLCYAPDGTLLGRIKDPDHGRQPHLRRPQAEPPLHNRDERPLRGLRRHDRSPASVSQASPVLETTRVIRLNPADNVVVAAAPIPAGTAIPGEGVTAVCDIPRGHKIAVRPIPAGEAVLKFAQIIGYASTDIAPGDHVHVHNCVMGEHDRDYAFGVDSRPTALVPESDRATFEGFVRPDGRVGTRNFIGIVSTVNCSATVSKMIAAHFEKRGLDAFPNVDGVAAFVHGTGCGLAGSGDQFDTIQRVMWGYARHPNCAGVLLVGLGCEVNQIRFLVDVYGIEEGETFQFLTIQEVGGTRRAVEEGIRRIEAMLPAANRAVRQAVSAEHITLALQCGGSDAFSGITANPALGAAADILVRHGGTAILAETPEIYGAEQLLTRRAASREVGERLIERIRWWEHYTSINGGDMNNNPSPGNKAGGLTTILEKSLGAAAKGGTTDLVDVIRYAEPVCRRGFVFMDSPGYDPVSITGEVASGSNVVCFTTGRARSPASSRRPASSSPPTPRCTGACPRTWTSTAARSSPPASRSTRWASASSPTFSMSRPAGARRARNSASATTNSRPGSSARSCESDPLSAILTSSAALMRGRPVAACRPVDAAPAGGARPGSSSWSSGHDESADADSANVPPRLVAAGLASARRSPRCPRRRRAGLRNPRRGRRARLCQPHTAGPLDGRVPARHLRLCPVVDTAPRRAAAAGAQSGRDAVRP